MLIVTDPTGLIRTVNRATYEQLGFRGSELFGQHVDLLLHDSEFESLDSGEHRFRTKMQPDYSKALLSDEVPEMLDTSWTVLDEPL